MQIESIHNAAAAAAIVVAAYSGMIIASLCSAATTHQSAPAYRRATCALLSDIASRVFIERARGASAKFAESWAKLNSKRERLQCARLPAHK